MKALYYDGTLGLREVEKPRTEQGEMLIQVVRAGICNTDHEITRGYISGFKGIPGHEFTGIVKEAQDKAWIGKRVTGEINIACGSCSLCAKGLPRHCVNRKVLGIIGKDGAFARYLTLPARNVVEIPEGIDDKAAVFIEPLAAALEILDQVRISDSDDVLLIGDGKLGLLIAHVLATTGCRLTVVGKHREKLDLLQHLKIRVVLLHELPETWYDVVVEASGNPSGFHLAQGHVRPRGVIVLKSTYAGDIAWNPSAFVVNELTLVGSRCGDFSRAIDFLRSHSPDLGRLIETELPLSKAMEAFALSARPETLKVVLVMDAES